GRGGRAPPPGLRRTSSPRPRPLWSRRAISIAPARKPSAWTPSRAPNSSPASVMRKSGPPLHAFAQNAEKTARRQRDIQKKVDRADKAVTRRKDKKSRAMQAGARRYPTGFL